MSDHLAKPIVPERLWAALQRWIVPATASAALQATAGAAPGGDGTVLPAAEGLDTAQGLRNAMGRHALYADLLRRFLDSQAGAAERVAQALAVGDAALALREAHTLRGLAGTVGAVALQDCAGRLEEALRDAPEQGAAVPLLLEPVRARLGALVQALQAWRGQPCGPAGEAGSGMEAVAPGTQDAARSVVQQLHGLLQRDDPAARTFLLDNDRLLRQALGPAWAGVRGHIDRFDFEHALAALTGWLAHFPQTPAHPPGQRRTGSHHAT